MANPKHVAKLREGWQAWNHWRFTSDERPDLSGLEVDDEVLFGFNLCDADLSSASLNRVVVLEGTCEQTSFAKAAINRCVFHYTQLPKATFKEAGIGFTVFHSCNMQDVDFSGAGIVASSFARSSLRNVRGLETIKSPMSNSVGIDTFFESGGLPESFLRGAGAPEQFIQYAASLAGKAIEYYSCFLSYSSKDDEFARRLYNDLQGKNIRTWFAPEDLKIGDRFRSRIDESIRVHDKLVLILSANSVASDWVETEVESALEREKKEGRDVLFPIAIDDEGFDSQQPWAADIRHKRQIGDFRRWKSHDDYTRAFEKLVRDLKKSQPPIIMRG